MANRGTIIGLIAAVGLSLSGCDDPDTSAIEVSAIGKAPRLANPNLVPLDPPAESLILTTAQGLVQFDAAGQIEPALAQSWIVSDDGLRYTFRLRRAQWSNGEPVTAEQVAERLRAAASRASRNPLKPLLGSIEEVVAMTDDVLEISLAGPRPNFLQLLAQPEMALVRAGSGAGAFHAVPQPDGALALHPPPEEDEEAQDESSHNTAILLRGERASLAVARFDAGQADLVIGGTAADLPIARAAEPGDALVFDPAAGLFGLSFASREGPLGEASVRRALAMAIDREALVAALGVPNLQPRASLVSLDIENAAAAQPDWAGAPLPMRRTQAAAAIADAQDETPLTLRVAMPEGPGYRLIFAHLARDWRAIGVRAERVPADARNADLRLIDRVAPVDAASWYLLQFSCSASAVCDPSADELLAAARLAPSAANRAALLVNADRILSAATPFIPLTAPVRWNLVSPRLTGFRPNRFARHNLAELIAQAP